jgi:hypothetical protein
MENKIDANAFADAVWQALPEQAEGMKSVDVAHPQSLASLSDLGAGFCDAWKKYEPQAERAIGFMKLFFPAPAAFLLAVLAAVKQLIIPTVCGVTSATAAPEVHTNVSQKAR